MGTCYAAAAANREATLELSLADEDEDDIACYEFYNMLSNFFGSESQEPVRMDDVIRYFEDDDGEGGAVHSLRSREGPMDFTPESLMEWHCYYEYYYYAFIMRTPDVNELDSDRCTEWFGVFYPEIDLSPA